MRNPRWLLLLIPALLVAGFFAYRSSQSSSRSASPSTSQHTTSDTTTHSKTPTDLSPLFISKLKQLVKQGSNGLYDLAIDRLAIDVLQSTVTLHTVSLRPDSTVLDSLRQLKALPEDVFNLAFDSLRIEGINLDDVINSKVMAYDIIRLVRPQITIHHTKGAVKKDVTEKETFSERFLKQMDELSVKNLVVQQGTVKLYNDLKGGPPTVFNQVSVALQNMHLDSTTRHDHERFLFAKSGTVGFRNYSQRTRDGLYTMKIGAVNVRVPQDDVELSQFSFTSPYNRTQFSKRQKKSKELYNLKLPSVTLANVNWWALFNGEEVQAETLKTTGGSLSIFLDRTLPPRNRMGNFPSQMLMKLPVQLRISNASMQNLDLSYAEYNPLSQATGTIYLNNVNLQITNLTNEKKTQPPPLVVSGTARFMKQVPVQAKFEFDMAQYKRGRFQAQIHTDGFPGSLINSFTVPMGMMRMDRGVLQSADATLQGDEKAASGTVFIPYKNLKLAILEKDAAGKAPDRKDVTSLFANWLVLKRHNPSPGKQPRKEEAAFTRIPEGGFFMLVWKTILVGALKTIGAPAKIASKTVSSSGKK